MLYSSKGLNFFPERTAFFVLTHFLNFVAINYFLARNNANFCE